MMKALLVRIGIDQTYGGWNAPTDKDGRFVFVPIPESEKTVFRDGLYRPFGEVIPALKRFCSTSGSLQGDSGLKFPAELAHRAMHLDPDFDHLTYGDDGAGRGSRIAAMSAGDMLVFYAGLRPLYPCEHRLIYALVGIFVVDEVLAASNVSEDRYCENAHTRKVPVCVSDIVVRAKPTASGRFEKCLPIGEYRDRAYRVRQDLLRDWGGLDVNGGFIQRSVRPPAFLHPEKFCSWLHQQGAALMRGNGWA